VNATLVENHAQLSTDRFEPIRRAVLSHTTMEQALAWFRSQVPPLVPLDLVPQDEFSYDLLVPYVDGLWLSYDTS